MKGVKFLLLVVFSVSLYSVDGIIVFDDTEYLDHINKKVVHKKKYRYKKYKKHAKKSYKYKYTKKRDDALVEKDILNVPEVETIDIQ